MRLVNESWHNVIHKIDDLRGDLEQFRVDFFDGDRFKNFFYKDWESTVQNFPNVCIMGYFSKTIKRKIQFLLRKKIEVKLISPDLSPKRSTRDEKNLEVLKNLVDNGAKIKINKRAHARLFIAYNPIAKLGWVIIGSFDFNSDCLGVERHDCGIKTRHPDLMKSAISFFDQIWNEPESKSLQEIIQKKK